MLQVLVFAVVIVLGLTEEIIKPRNLHPDVGLNIIELVIKYGYPIESHQIQTEDGYLLTLHRIPHGVNNNQIGPPVLLMHGLLSSSVDWVSLGPEKSLGLLLADSGFDVWIGNQRGNTWSRKHVQIDPDQNPEVFFNFSFHEIGVYDMPAQIDYILDKTGEEKLTYVGHSQGTTVFFIMASERPEYNDKIKLMIALAPVAYIGNLPNPFIRQAVEHFELVNTLIEVFQIHEFFPHYKFVTELGERLCSDTSKYQDVCVWVLNAVGGFDYEIDPNFIPVITSNTPAGAAIKQVLHYFQGVQSGRFSQYDHGTSGNRAKYGQDTPPSYKISKITAPVSLHYSRNDWLVAVEDVQNLAEELPNVVGSKLIPLEQFNHLDFLWAQHVVELLNNGVIAEIKSIN